jgi:hypothetical protein
VFETRYAPASFTVASISTMLAGRYPEPNSIASNESILTEGVTTLASLLTDHGYQCAAVVSNWVLRPGGGLERGIAEYDARFPQLETARGFPNGRRPLRLTMPSRCSIGYEVRIQGRCFSGCTTRIPTVPTLHPMTTACGSRLARPIARRRSRSIQDTRSSFPLDATRSGLAASRPISESGTIRTRPSIGCDTRPRSATPMRRSVACSPA